MKLYQRFFEYIYHNLQYINDSTQNIDLPTRCDNSYKELFQNSSPYIYSLYLIGSFRIMNK
ncbi:hypothetical protein COJ50_13920 [Bacillus cereus]|uniref:Uncharacterized protein n=1 Tax=Bacillus cereus TaxID=1396 RepID=A0A2A8R695_BACCE|nr:hypothetical protein CN450_17720 [Bacillus cereus]PFN24797.1 hypothetical protein COJ50_13920 [Bacillus cereus]